MKTRIVIAALIIGICDDVVPDSIGEILFEILCKKNGDKK